MIVKQRVARRTIHYWNHTPQTNRIGDMGYKIFTSFQFDAQPSPFINPITDLTLLVWTARDKWLTWLRGSDSSSRIRMQYILTLADLGDDLLTRRIATPNTYMRYKQTHVFYCTQMRLLKEKPRWKMMWYCISDSRVKFGEICSLICSSVRYESWIE